MTGPGRNSKLTDIHDPDRNSDSTDIHEWARQELEID
jgi:hypothetical protein